MIVFSHPAKKAGGVQTLIINLAQYLSAKRISKVGIIDNADGFVKQHLDELSVNYVFINLNNKRIIYESLTKDDVFVSFDNVIKDSAFLAKTDAKLLYWQVFPTRLVSLFKTPFTTFNQNKTNKNSLYFYLTKKLITTLKEGKALYVMDESHWGPLSKFGIKQFDIDLLPIPVTLEKENFYRKREKNNVLNISCIGRGESKWKVLPVKKLLTDIQHIDAEIHIHIITTDPDQFINHLMPVDIKKYPKKISFHTDLSGNKLNIFLKQNIDLAFAMGTSLLETAKLGVPTVILDPSFDELPENYQYRWLFQTEGYTLGYPLWYYDPKPGISISRIIDILESTSMRKAVSEKCFSYVEDNHSLDKVVKLFVKAAHNTQIRAKSLNLFNHYFCAKTLLNKTIEIFRLK